MTIELSRSIESVRPSVPIVGHADDMRTAAAQMTPFLRVPLFSSYQSIIYPAVRYGRALPLELCSSMIQRVSSIQILLLLFILWLSICSLNAQSRWRRKWKYKTRCADCVWCITFSSIYATTRGCCRGTGEKPLPTCSYLSISTSSFFRISFLLETRWLNRFTIFIVLIRGSTTGDKLIHQQQQFSARSSSSSSLLFRSSEL